MPLNPLGSDSVRTINHIVTLVTWLQFVVISLCICSAFVTGSCYSPLNYIAFAVLPYWALNSLHSFWSFWPQRSKYRNCRRALPRTLPPFHPLFLPLPIPLTTRASRPCPSNPLSLVSLCLLKVPPTDTWADGERFTFKPQPRKWQKPLVERSKRETSRKKFGTKQRGPQE